MSNSMRAEEAKLRELDDAEKLALKMGLTDYWVPGVPDMQQVEHIREFKRDLIRQCAEIARKFDLEDCSQGSKAADAILRAFDMEEEK